MLTILITGANGLLGRIFSAYLSKNGYKILGIDQAEEGTPSQRFIVDQATDSPLLAKAFSGNYFKADIRDFNALREIIKRMGKIDMVIHLATAGEMDTPETVTQVNEMGTKHIFQLCEEEKITKIIFASSIMTVGGFLCDKKPYSYINCGAYNKLPSDLTKITSDYRMVPEKISPTSAAYITSKLRGEDLALSYVERGISTLCLRFGAMSSTDLPYDPPGLRSIWCSHKDASIFVGLAVKNLIATLTPSVKTYFVCSCNDYLWVDMQNAKRDLGFTPQDNAEAALTRSKLNNKIDKTNYQFTIFKKEVFYAPLKKNETAPKLLSKL